MKFLGGGKVFYAVIFMRILCLLNYHVKSDLKISLLVLDYYLNAFIKLLHKIANIAKIPANDVLTGLLLFWQ